MYLLRFLHALVIPRVLARFVKIPKVIDVIMNHVRSLEVSIRKKYIVKSLLSSI